MTIVALAIATLGLAYTLFRNRARRGTRQLLVNCEIALGFYEQGVYVHGGRVNPPGFIHYPETGEWLGYLSVICVLAAAAAYVILMS